MKDLNPAVISPWSSYTKNLKYKLSRLVMPNSPSASSIPFVEYLKWHRFTRFTPQYPHSIDIQTRSGCNARCTFCGVGREENKIIGEMSDELFKKIIDEVMEFPNLRQINPYLLNDPLVDRRIAERIEYIAQKRNSRKKPLLRIITNAGLLTKEMSYRLLQSGLDEINVSFHSIKKEVYEDLMRPLNYEKVMQNVLTLVELRNQLASQGTKTPKISVWTVLTKPVEENLKNEKAYWKKIGISFKARKLDNRAQSKIEEANFSNRPFNAVAICPIPFWRAWVMFNGDMIMCCVDQERSRILGNCSQRPIREIWNDEAYQALRRSWRKKELKGLLCHDCKGS